MATAHDELKTLATFHYVLAGIEALFALFPVIHLVIGLGLLSGAIPGPRSGGPEQLVGWLFVGVAVVFIAAGLTMAALTVVAGRSLAAHRRHTFCMVVAGVNCMFVPFGTVLGVFTLVALQRAEVKAAFGLAQDGSPVAARP